MSDNTPSEKARQQIDANLKRVFQAEAEAELPDRLKSLLEQLKSQDSQSDQDTGAGE